MNTIKLKLMETPCVSANGYSYPANFWKIIMNSSAVKEMINDKMLFVKPISAYEDDKFAVSFTNLLGVVESYDEKDNSVNIVPIGDILSDILKEDCQHPYVLTPYIKANVNQNNEIVIDEINLMCLHLKEKE